MWVDLHTGSGRHGGGRCRCQPRSVTATEKPQNSLCGIIVVGDGGPRVPRTGRVGAMLETMDTTTTALPRRPCV